MRLRQLPLFDVDAGGRLRDRGIDLAQASAGTVWSEYALRTLEALCRERRAVHTDDLMAALDWHPTSPNAFGAVWQAALRRRWIERTGQTRVSAQPGKHAHRMPVYRSLLYGQHGQHADGEADG